MANARESVHSSRVVLPCNCSISSLTCKAVPDIWPPQVVQLQRYFASCGSDSSNFSGWVSGALTPLLIQSFQALGFSERDAFSTWKASAAKSPPSSLSDNAWSTCMIAALSKRSAQISSPSLNDLVANSPSPSPALLSPTSATAARSGQALDIRVAIESAVAALRNTTDLLLATRLRPARIAQTEAASGAIHAWLLPLVRCKSSEA
mmetsp:Transcript_42718/g.99649  ORF Transcript_42718/g.99649 Transcript_42718/m.99649 type:complete len:206 (-) Transcript_42718:128-745(-)